MAEEAGAAEPSWEPLIAGDWTLEPGTEDYVCVRKTLTEDVYMAAYRPQVLDDPALHHGTLGLVTDSPAAEPDGTTKCDGFTNGNMFIAGIGPGMGDTAFPVGIAAKIEAGTQIILNLHLFNTGIESITGTSGIDIVRLDADQVTQEAEGVLAGKVLSLAVPPGESTQTGTCMLAGDVTIFAASSHMHQLGTHLMARTLPAVGDPVVILDEPYDFNHQTVSMLEEPIALKQGDTIEINCTYQNPGDTTVPFGQSSTQEMCFAGLFWYPPLNAGNACFND